MDIKDLQQFIEKHGDINSWEMEKATKIVRAKNIVQKLEKSLKNIAIIDYTANQDNFIIEFGDKKFNCEPSGKDEIYFNSNKLHLDDVPCKLIVDSLLTKSIKFLKSKFTGSCLTFELRRYDISLEFNLSQLLQINIRCMNINRSIQFNIGDIDLDKNVYNIILDIYIRNDIANLVLCSDNLPKNKSIQNIYKPRLLRKSNSQ
jgi:hypothetical protein